MPCFCSAQLSSLLPKLSGIPSLAGLVPPIPPLLLPAISPPPLPVGPAVATASASANAALAANLAVMASLKADVHAAMGMNLMASLSGPPLASLQASFAQTVGSMNAHTAVLLPYQDLLSRLLQELANLMRLAGLVTAVQARFGINLRAAGAIPLLQARMTALARAQASARATATAHASAMASMMAALGFALTPAGASALGVSMQALARVGMTAPPLTANLGLMSLLSALMAMLQAIRNALGVNMLAANAVATLRATLGTLPLGALASLQAQASAMASATASASASASASMPALNLRAAARANMLPASRLALAMRLAVHANMLMLPAGQCGKPCPVAAVKTFT